MIRLFIALLLCGVSGLAHADTTYTFPDQNTLLVTEEDELEGDGLHVTIEIKGCSAEVTSVVKESGETVAWGATISIQSLDNHETTSYSWYGHDFTFICGTNRLLEVTVSDGLEGEHPY